MFFIMENKNLFLKTVSIQTSLGEKTKWRLNIMLNLFL